MWISASTQAGLSLEVTGWTRRTTEDFFFTGSTGAPSQTCLLPSGAVYRAKLTENRERPRTLDRAAPPR